MKIKNILLTAGLSLTLGVAALAGSLSSNKAEAVKADGQSTIVIEIGNNCNWHNKAGDEYCKLGVYFYTNDVGSVWGGLLQMDGSQFYTYTYETNSYSNMIVARINPSATEGSWSDVYNQTKDLSKAGQVTIFNQDEGEGHDGKYWANTNYRDLTAASLTGDLSGELNIPARDSEDKLEMVGTNFSISSGDKFKISYKGTEYASLNSGVSSDLFEVSEGYIVAKASGNFDMYFNTDSKMLWIEENAAQAAIEFSEDFNDAMETPCSDEDANNYAAVSAIWDTWKGKFEALTIGAKAEFATNTNAEVVQARSCYNHCVSRYDLSTWTGAPAVHSIRINSVFNGDVTPVIVITVSAVLALALVGFVVFKKKHN